MQGIILANNRVMSGRLTQGICLEEINGETLIERMLKQLEKYDLAEIIIVADECKAEIVDVVSKISFKTKIHFVDAEKNIEDNSLYHIKDILIKDESLVLNSNIIFEDSLLDALMESKGEMVAVVDKYKSWMTGDTVILNDRNQIIGIKDKKQIDHLSLQNDYKTVGMYKVEASFFEEEKRPSAEICLADERSWFEINDIQDLKLASILFSEDEDYIVENMLGSWGGYWRYPEYLDYFYLVTPYYPTPALVEELKSNFDNLLVQYPSGMRVNAMLAAKEFFVKPENIIIGNGAAELIKSIMSLVKGRTGFIRPTFEEYPNRLTEEEHICYWVESDDFTYDVDDLIQFFKDKDIKNLVLVNPENPSGNYINRESMYKLLDWTLKENIKVIIDESFVDFVDEPEPTLIRQDILDKYRNLYVVKSISKSYGVPGLRLGVLASGDIDTIAWMKKDVSIWNINSFAEFYMQIAGKYREDYKEALERFRKERVVFQKELSKVKGIRVIPSQANYVMVELTDGIDAEVLKRRMLIEEKVFIKTLGKKIKNGKQYLRLAIRNHEDNEKLIIALGKVIGE